MNATAEAINNFGIPLAAEQMPARIAQPFDIGSTALPPVIEVHPYEGSASTQASSLQQECVQAGLAMPQIVSKPTMYDAGIRITGPGVVEQHVKGKFGLSPMPVGCAPDFERAMTGQLQMRNTHNPKAPVNLTPRSTFPGYFGNQVGTSDLFWAPTHAWPARIFNQCVGQGKHSWLKVEDVITLIVRNEQIHQIVGTQEKPVPVEVRGNCAAAQKSAELTKDWPVN